ncbi:MAG: DUF3833 family protein [Gammaproteobacteria bacterium]|nr:DUF3833 family protein [Gammaproteobacteria bacterium]
MKTINFTLLLLAIVVSFTLSACSATLKDYQNTDPEFDLQEFFTGELKGWGLIKDWQGKVTQRFSVELDGKWQDNKGTLYELFKYSDGRTQERLWRLETLKDGTSVGTANDVIGEARGQQSGFTFNWSYQLLIDTADGPIEVRLDDWIYQIDSDALVSEAQIKKFGINVGEVLVFIVKQDQNNG